MSQWKVFARDPINQAELSNELLRWVGKAHRDLVVFREGATISQIIYASNSLVEKSELEALQIIRLFCPRFELYARRYSYNDGGVWQLRIASGLDDLPDGILLEAVNKTQVLLLGEQADRYRRANFGYHNLDGTKSRCALRANIFRPQSVNKKSESDAAIEQIEEETICCWASINERESAANNQQ